jgi:hypothetical protein
LIVMFKKGKVLICPKGDIPDTTMSIGVREGNLYRLQGNPIQALYIKLTTYVSYGI